MKNQIVGTKIMNRSLLNVQNINSTRGAQMFLTLTLCLSMGLSFGGLISMPLLYAQEQGSNQSDPNDSKLKSILSSAHKRGQIYKSEQESLNKLLTQENFRMLLEHEAGEQVKAGRLKPKNYVLDTAKANNLQLEEKSDNELGEQAMRTNNVELAGLEVKVKNINETNQRIYLFGAMMRGHDEVFHELIKGIDLNQSVVPKNHKYKELGPILYQASVTDQLNRFIKPLIEAGAALKYNRDRDYAPIDLAVDQGAIKNVQTLLDLGMLPSRSTFGAAEAEFYFNYFDHELTKGTKYKVSAHEENRKSKTKQTAALELIKKAPLIVGVDSEQQPILQFAKEGKLDLIKKYLAEDSPYKVSEENLVKHAGEYYKYLIANNAINAIRWLDTKEDATNLYQTLDYVLKDLKYNASGQTLKGAIGDLSSQADRTLYHFLLERGAFKALESSGAWLYDALRHAFRVLDRNDFMTFINEFKDSKSKDKILNYVQTFYVEEIASRDANSQSQVFKDLKAFYEAFPDFSFETPLDLNHVTDLDIVEFVLNKTKPTSEIKEKLINELNANLVLRHNNKRVPSSTIYQLYTRFPDVKFNIPSEMAFTNDVELVEFIIASADVSTIKPVLTRLIDRLRTHYSDDGLTPAIQKILETAKQQNESASILDYAYWQLKNGKNFRLTETLKLLEGFDLSKQVSIICELTRIAYGSIDDVNKNEDPLERQRLAFDTLAKLVKVDGFNPNGSCGERSFIDYVFNNETRPTSDSHLRSELLNLLVEAGVKTKEVVKLQLKKTPVNVDLVKILMTNADLNQDIKEWNKLGVLIREADLNINDELYLLDLLEELIIKSRSIDLIRNNKKQRFLEEKQIEKHQKQRSVLPEQLG